LTSPVPHQALYRRWRAQTFGEIVGQEAVVETLRNAVRTGRVSHAVLFVGPRGTGKTSLARILAKAVNCTDLRDGDACDACPSCVSIREGRTLDLVEIDAASNRGIDAVRDLRERLPYPPGELKRKVYILDEAHQITKDAWNALLKSLEEPPEFVVFMFASTEPSMFPPAILSRLQRYDVRRLTIPEIEGKLARILEADGRTAEPAALSLIARLAAGGMRDAESMLDQLLSAAPGDIDERRVRDLLGLADADAVEAFIDALVAGDAATGIALLDDLEERGRDARTLLDQTIDAIRGRLVTDLASGEAGAVPGLADAARRLAAIDPERAGVGGLRLQLELALFTTSRGTTTASTSTRPAAAQPATGQRSAPTAPPPSVPSSDAAPSPRTVVVPPAVAGSTSDPGAGSPDASATEAAPAPKARPARTSAASPPEPAPVDPPVAAAEPVAVSDPAAAAGPPAAEPPANAAAEPPAERATAAEPAAAATHAAAAAADLGPDLARLRDGWPTIVASVQPAVRAVINECRPMGVEGNVVTLGFPESKGFLKDHAERRRPELEAAIGGFLGRDVSVRSVATNLELVPPAADDLVAEARRIFADDLADVGEVR
jgi:DNA polymerase-3 subunit gamma/tau